MKKFNWLSGLVLTGLFFPLSASQVTFRDLLQSVSNDPVVLSQDQKDMRVRKSFSGIPGIDDLEFQFRNTGFSSDEFRYTVQLRPRGFMETRAAGRYDDAIISNTDLKRKLLLNRAIYDRYLLFIDVLEQKTLQGLYCELLTLYDDRIEVMEKLIYSEDFRLEELIEVENDRTKEKMKSLEIDKFISVLQRRAKAFLGDTSFCGFDTTDIVGIKTIMKRIETTDYSLDTNNVYLQFYRTRLELARARFGLEKAQSRSYIDQISFSYDNGDMVNEYERKYQSKDYDFKKSYALEIGLRIPDLTLRGYELNRRRADVLSEIERYEQVRGGQNEKMHKDLADLRQLIAQYRYLNDRETMVDAEASLKKFLDIEGIDPLILLDVKENILKNQINKTSIKYGILRNYLYVIDNAGMLSGEPARNYLSENQETVK